VSTIVMGTSVQLPQNTFQVFVPEGGLSDEEMTNPGKLQSPSPSRSLSAVTEGSSASNIHIAEKPVPPLHAGSQYNALPFPFLYQGLPDLVKAIGS